MMLDPFELKMLSRKMDSPTCKIFELKLQEFHARHVLNSYSILLIPRFWCETVFLGLQEMLEEFPNLKIGSVIEHRNRLRIFTIPTTGAVEMLKVKLYNKIDTLVLETIDCLLKGDKKPFFMT